MVWLLMVLFLKIPVFWLVFWLRLSLQLSKSIGFGGSGRSGALVVFDCRAGPAVGLAEIVELLGMPALSKPMDTLVKMFI